MKPFGTAAILAGGMSSRMGFDKQLLTISRKRLIAGLLPRLAECFDDILVVTNFPELYNRMPVRTVSDIIPGKGPLSGIHAALQSSKSSYVYFMACDMPCFEAEYAEYMKQRLLEDPNDACVTRRGVWIEPFHAFYNQTAIGTLEADLNADKTSVFYLLKKLSTLYISEEEARRFSSNWSLFCNLNTREEYFAYLNLQKG